VHPPDTGSTCESNVTLRSAAPAAPGNLLNTESTVPRLLDVSLRLASCTGEWYARSSLRSLGLGSLHLHGAQKTKYVQLVPPDQGGLECVQESPPCGLPGPNHGP
jgi:hypothetical protein